MKEFKDDDVGYLRWVDEHPAGYVVNIERSLNPNSLMLHQTTCYCIANERTGSYLTRSYIKFCSTRRADLVTWAQQDLRGKLRLCKHCNP